MSRQCKNQGRISRSCVTGVSRNPVIIAGILLWFACGRSKLGSKEAVIWKRRIIVENSISFLIAQQSRAKDFHAGGVNT